MGSVAGKKEVLGQVAGVLLDAKKRGIAVADILEALRETYGDAFAEELFLPISIFSNDSLGALEATIVYLREYKNYKFKTIGRFLKRSEIVVGHSYRSARRKTSQELDISDKRYVIPLSLFADRKHSVQRQLVRYLHDVYKLRFCDIARLLARNPRTIWTAYHAVGGVLHDASVTIKPQPKQRSLVAACSSYVSVGSVWSLCCC